MENLVGQYQERKDRFAEKAAQLQAKYNRLALVRLSIFVAAVAIGIYLGSLNIWALFGFIFLFLLGFSRFVFWHIGIQKEQYFFAALSKVNEHELQALSGDISAFDDGEEFANPLHPYTIDLDLFGPFSFFQFSNRTSTAIGKRCLANWLQKAPEKKEIDLRQKAVLELKDLLEWRQAIQAKGMVTEDQIQHIHALQRWMEAPPFVSNNQWLKIALWINPIWTLAVLALFILYIPWYAALLLLLPTLWILRKTLEQVNDTHQQTADAGDILSFYADLIKHIEEQTFQSEKLQALQAHFIQSDDKASDGIRRLGYIINQLNVRYNAFAIILNIFMLWDLSWIKKLEAWKAQFKDNLPKWFDSLEQIEALLSLATIYYNNPDWQMPLIDEGSQLKTVELGHPLIKADTRISNNFDIPISGHIKLVTGSNMAGKSTFLRTVGLNIVLANTGSAVCATSFQGPILNVYTSMRTQDALHESTSSFYAELKRLKTIIEAVENGDRVFFLLDEILKGTNSNDRHTGSKALIKQLIHSGGSGIIATHDLELGALEAQYDGTIENLCMEVAIENGQLDFDYKIKKGVSKSFNATLLMKEMGIRIEE